MALSLVGSSETPLGEFFIGDSPEFIFGNVLYSGLSTVDYFMLAATAKETSLSDGFYLTICLSANLAAFKGVSVWDINLPSRVITVEESPSMYET
jgi:hypothetical protein